MRLPAPMIEGTLPAFYADEKGIAKLTSGKVNEARRSKEYLITFYFRNGELSI